VDGLVAGRADHEGLPAHGGHEVRPRGLRSSWPGEVGKLADLVDFHHGALFAPLAPPVNCRWRARAARIARHLRTLVQVGLGYVRLGQPATTLSGGEAQRVKLAAELQKRSTGRTIYMLDEPTTGLHAEDVRKLLGVLHSLVNMGNTVLVIEHNLDVIKTADWVIDLGPAGGPDGGLLVAQGTPEEVSLVEDSYTGRFLRPLLGEADADSGSGEPGDWRRAA
jgi:excinuclease ABC subunit A